MTTPTEESLDRARLEQLQQRRLRALLDEVLPRNRFVAHKFAEAGLSPAAVQSPSDLRRLPFTTKAELVADQQANPPYGSFLTYSLTRYSRLHQTSGTSGRPLRWLDTPQSWSWMLDCWEAKYRVAGLGENDRFFFPFSFGPFLGFWTAFEAAGRRGWLCLAGGGMSTSARLRFLLDNQVTVVLCTPTYALRLAEVAREEGLDLADSSVRALIVAGEPGGGIPATRQRLETAWGARVFDHSGMTETGPMTAECIANPGGLHVLEQHYIAEVVDLKTQQPVPPGELGELVVTNLGRLGSPVLRYRTGDLVRVDPQPCRCGRSLRRLDGGILGRTDDMIHLRGNNFYPSALEAVIRRFADVAEYRVEIDQSGTLPVLRVDLEPADERIADLGERVDRAIRDEFLFRAEVRLVAAGSLPRFEMKARRVIHHKATPDKKPSQGESPHA
jgi:phenylacetate-CoA ligase